MLTHNKNKTENNIYTPLKWLNTWQNDYKIHCLAFILSVWLLMFFYLEEHTCSDHYYYYYTEFTLFEPIMYIKEKYCRFRMRSRRMYLLKAVQWLCPVLSAHVHFPVALFISNEPVDDGDKLSGSPQLFCQQLGLLFHPDTLTLQVSTKEVHFD